MSLKIKYSLLAITGGSKLAYATACQKKLQIEQNGEHARFLADQEKFAKEEIPQEDWDVAKARWLDYNTTLFNPTSDLIVKEILKWRAYTQTFVQWNPDLTTNIIEEAKP